eukprot:TRINITY_DN7950_c0_g1_i1.p1 TRINITY_DN7950_c0_g1~~TRINITY_DN7950_c0_g1_i1.p1  ORF type:complete len:162 (+),score=45.23 TRINITY_DN7950_c0_g1_i1:92-577(+)
MPPTVGSRVADGALMKIGAGGRPEAVKISKLLAGRRVVIFGVPGAFTPTCSMQHLPGFVAKAPEILSKGVDEVVCVSVNDAFVMKAWGDHSSSSRGPVTMLADGSAKWAKAAGIEMDLTAVGMGMRCKRFVMIARDGVVEHYAEDMKALKSTSAEAALAKL